MQLKERVVCQQQNEALTDGAGGTEDTFVQSDMNIS